jgi:hypothetical protein
MPEWRQRAWSGGVVEELYVAPGDTLRDALVLLWARAFEWLASVEPRYDWDTVTACVRPDSGSIRLSAHLADGGDSVPGGPPNAVSRDLEQRWYDLPDPDEPGFDESAFDEAHGRLMAEVMDDLRAAVRTEPAASALARLRRGRRVRVVAMEYHDAETAVELT